MKSTVADLEIRFNKDLASTERAIDNLTQKIAGLGQRIKQLEQEPTGIQCIEALDVAMKRHLSERQKP